LKRPHLACEDCASNPKFMLTDDFEYYRNSHAEKSNRSIAGSSLAVFDNRGHVPQFEKAEILTRKF